jgi:hypothetical protein
MEAEKELNLRLYIIGDGAHQGPIAFGSFEHHCLHLVSNNMHVLGLGPGDYRAFRPATGEFVGTDRTFRDLKAREGEPFVLVKDLDLEAVRLVWKVIRPVDDEPASSQAAAKAPPVNVGLGWTGPTISTDIMEWGRRLHEKIRLWFR